MYSNERLKERIEAFDAEIDRISKLKELLCAALSGNIVQVCQSGNIVQMYQNEGQWVDADEVTLLHAYHPKYYRLKPQTLWMVATMNATHGKYHTREEAERAMKNTPRLEADGFKIYKIEEDTNVP